MSVTNHSSRLSDWGNGQHHGPGHKLYTKPIISKLFLLYTSSYPTNNPDMSPRSSMPKFYLRLISKNPDMSPWRKEDFLDFLFLLEM